MSAHEWVPAWMEKLESLRWQLPLRGEQKFLTVPDSSGTIVGMNIEEQATSAVGDAIRRARNDSYEAGRFAGYRNGLEVGKTQGNIKEYERGVEDGKRQAQQVFYWSGTVFPLPDKAKVAVALTALEKTAKELREDAAVVSKNAWVAGVSAVNLRTQVEALKKALG